MWAIIGGSGFENFDEFSVVENLKIETPYGDHSSGFKRVKWQNTECLFLSRHGDSHELLPSEINYKANIYALSKMGAKGVLSFSAVGSLKEELAPKDMVLVNQYIDFTKKRDSTFCGEGSVGHLSYAESLKQDVVNELKDLGAKYSFKAHYGKTYICVEGPRFSSIAESLMFKSWGADIIGMTNMPESYLAMEAGLLYIPLCFVTDYDCWKEDEEHVTIEIVKKRMDSNFDSAKEVLNAVIKKDLFNKYPVSSINSAIFSGDKIKWVGDC